MEFYASLKSYIQSTFFYLEPVGGSWAGQIKIKNNPEDSDYKGPGDYVLKAKRYTGQSSSAAGESNSLTISLISPTPTPSPTPTASPTPKPTATTTSKVIATPTPPTSKATGGTAATPKPTTLAQVLAATAAAEVEETPTPMPSASATPEPEKAEGSKFAWLMIAGGGVLAVVALFPVWLKWYHDPSWLKTLLKGGDQSSFGQE